MEMQENLRPTAAPGKILAATYYQTTLLSYLSHIAEQCEVGYTTNM